MSVFEQACRGEEQKIVEFIHAYPDRIRDRNEKGSSLLLCAASCGNTSIVELIYDFAPDLLDVADNEGMTPLYHAAGKNHLCTVRTLVRLGCDRMKADDEGRTPLISAILYKAKRTFDYLLDNCPDALSTPTKKQNLPVHVATLIGNAWALKRILRLSPAMHLALQPISKETPLHIAARTSSNRCVFLLLQNERGREATMMRDAVDNRPIVSALARGNVMIIGMIIRACPTDVKALLE